MKKFQRAYVDLKQVAETRTALLKLYSSDLVDVMLKNLAEEEIYLNDKYQVHLTRSHIEELGVNMVHLSIKSIDKAPIRDWRDMQEIKNMLVGPECEGVELYPAESRLVDTANQYHLWVLDDSTIRWPFGFNDGRVVSGETKLPALPRARQRPRKSRGGSR